MRQPNRRAFLSGVAASLAPLSSAAPVRAASPMGPRIVEARPGKAAIAAGETEILGFDGVTPGPVLRYRQNQELAVRLVNKLDDLPASIHWHGLRGDNAMEGVAPLTQDPVAPGASFDYRRKLSEPGLFCYRPSVYGKTPELMGRGLKGLLVVDEPDPLPADHDLLLVLDDWRLSKDKVDGPFDDPAEARGAGRIGPLLAVNGKSAPATLEFEANSRVRLRLANLANARIMILTFDGVQPFVVAIDSQPCDAFEPVRRSIPVAPGARFELIFDMPSAEGAKARLFLRSAEGGESDLLVATAKGARAEKRGLIYGLPQNPALPPEIKLNNARKVDLVVEPGPPGGAGWTINGAVSKAYGGPPLFSVKRGTPVTLGYANKAKVPLAMHVHGHATRLLHDLDDGWEPYWRNGVIVPAGKTKHVAFVADSPGKWAIHDDILEHEAAGLATWFEVA